MIHNDIVQQNASFVNFVRADKQICNCTLAVLSVFPKMIPTLSGGRVSGGHLYEAEAPTEGSETSALGVPTGEIRSSPIYKIKA